MNVEDIRERVTDLSLSGILRCLRVNTKTGLQVRIQDTRNLNYELLRFYWALSRGIEDLAMTVVQHPRRLTTAIAFEEVERVGEITGSLNAGASAIAQSLTQNPALFIMLEPNVTAVSEPNHLVAWVLSEALNVLLSARRFQRTLEQYDWINHRISLLEQSLRNEILSEVMVGQGGRRMPGVAALRAAAKARIPVYQKAIEMYDLIESIEDGQIDAIQTLISNTITADLEDWQKLELATALMVADSLGSCLGSTVILDFPFVSGRPVAKVGPFTIYWQYSITRRSVEQMDLTERWASEIASSLGVRGSDARSDVTVCHEDKVVALFECKYFESLSSVTQAIVDASTQIVRYARDLNPESISNARKLIDQSWIIVADRATYSDVTVPYQNYKSTYFTDIKGLDSNALRCWAIDLSSQTYSY